MTFPIPVLLTAQELTQGGSERQLCEVAKALDRRRFQPHVGCFRSSGLRLAELRDAGIPVAVFPFRSFARPGVARAALELGRYLVRHGIQVAHSFDTPANVVAVPVARGARVPAVISSQRAFRTLAPPGFQHLLRLTDQLADRIVVNCQALRQHLEREEKAPRSKIRLRYNGVDTQTFSSGPAAGIPELAAADLVVGVVCALRPEKDLPTLMNAFAMACEPGWRLLITGDGPVLPRLMEMAGAGGIRSQCVFVPATADVVPWLRSIHIFVLPSLSEAFSNSLMEAMACGCTAIASRTGGNPELVLDGETGLLFTPGDAADLAAKLRRLASDQPLRLRLRDAARTRMASQFSLAAAARGMEELYLEALDSGKA